MNGEGADITDIVSIVNAMKRNWEELLKQKEHCWNCALWVNDSNDIYHMRCTRIKDRLIFTIPQNYCKHWKEREDNETQDNIRS